jgi:hypothetical protein
MIKVSVQRLSTTGDDSSSTIGGFDHNFPHVERYQDVTNRFFVAVTQRWPNAIFHVYDRDDNETILHTRDLPISVPEKGCIIVVRDEQMDEHLEQEGGVPMPDGESSLLLWVSPVAGNHHYLDLVTVNDPLENAFCWWAVEQLWDAYLAAKKSVNSRL